MQLNDLSDDICSMELCELEKAILSLGEKKFRATQIFNWIHKKNVNSFDNMKNISSELRSKLEQKFCFYNINILKKLVCSDETIKFLYELADKNIIESVLMRYNYGNTVCVSSQVGCRMNCRFCASTTNGLKRNLLASEMLNQVYMANKISRISNIVIMGSGEPLDNYNNVLKFIKIINSPNGLNISQRNITLSTCGLVNKIYSLAEEKLKINLAVSLHAPSDPIRKKIMPVVNKYLIGDIMRACNFYFSRTGRRITFEYVLIKGLNDQKIHAYELAKLIRGFACHVNLISLNRTNKSDLEPSNNKTRDEFKKILEKNNIKTTVRRKLGSGISAACGQLKNKFIDSYID